MRDIDIQSADWRIVVTSDVLSLLFMLKPFRLPESFNKKIMVKQNELNPEGLNMNRKMNLTTAGWRNEFDTKNIQPLRGCCPIGKYTTIHIEAFQAS